MSTEPRARRPEHADSPAYRGGSGCPFCAIVSGEAEAMFAGQWPETIAIHPLNPVTEGHVLVIPKAHIVSALADPLVAGTTFARAAEYAAGRGPVNLITSAGTPATQTVFHLHVHVVPRAPGDGLPLPWTPQQEAANAQ